MKAENLARAGAILFAWLTLTAESVVCRMEGESAQRPFTELDRGEADESLPTPSVVRIESLRHPGAGSSGCGGGGYDDCRDNYYVAMYVEDLVSERAIMEFTNAESILDIEDCGLPYWYVGERQLDGSVRFLFLSPLPNATALGSQSSDVGCVHGLADSGFRTPIGMYSMDDVEVVDLTE